MTVTDAPRIVIATGGTAGHVVPAIAVADALRDSGAQVSFVGADRAEAELVPAAGYPLDRIRVEGISRSDPIKAARAVVRAGAALLECDRILARRGADAVLGGGGYVAGPVGAAALRRRLPLVLTEADSHLGLTNRLLARGARRVCLAFPLEGHSGERFRVTGRPTPPLGEDPDALRAGAREEFGVGPGERLVVVFGGSLGARSINLAAVEGLADLPGDIRVLHLSGRRDFDALTEPAGGRYSLRPYYTPFARVLAAADLAVARSGGSVFELAALGVPAVLVPYPHAAADHQTANARWMVDAGAAVLVRDEEVDADRLRQEVLTLLEDPDRLAQMAAASSALARPRAARDVADEVLAAAATRRR